MAHDIEIIRQIEKQIGGKLKPLPLKKIMDGGNNGYAIDHTGQVRGLNLDRRRIKDISFLRSLSGLLYLSLRNIRITDLTPLSVLTNLIVLVLGGNQITDLTPLRELKHLKDLDRAKRY